MTTIFSPQIYVPFVVGFPFSLRPLSVYHSPFSSIDDRGEAIFAH